MPAPAETSAFPGPAFLRAMLRWSAVAAALVLAAGTLLTRDARFALSFLLAAGVDVGAVSLTLARTRRGDSAAGVGVAFAGRLAAKAVLLGVAAASPAFLSLAGAAMGALVFDTTLLLAGSVAAARATFPVRTGPGGGGPHTCEGGV